MNHPDQSSATEGSRKFTRGPLALTVAATVALGALGLVLGQDTRLASAEPAQTVQTPYGAAPLSFADLVQKVSPAVVSINVKGEDRVAENEFQIPGIPEDSPFYDFFKQFRDGMPKGNMPPRPNPAMAQGSGFFVTPDGYLVTNNHVVEDAEEVTVTLENGDKYPAKLVGSDPRTDIAVLKVSAPKELPYVKFSGKDPRVGDWVLAVGNPFGLGGSVTAGIISAHDRDIGSGPYNFLQIDAAVNRGNSGGPSFNLDGEVIGMNTAIFSPSGGNVGIAFAVPAELVKEVVDQLREHGTIDRGWLGVVIQNVTDDIADSIGLSEAKGAMVTKVAEDGPASKSDIKAGDVILQVNGEKVQDSRDLARKIAELHPDTDVKLTVARYGDERNVNLKLGKFPSNKKLAALEQEEKPNAGEQLDNLGLSVAPAAKIPGAGDEGVVITEISPGSDAADKGLKVGDVILQVSDVTVTGPGDVAQGVQRAIERAKDKEKVKVLLQVKTGDQTRFVALSLKKARV